VVPPSVTLLLAVSEVSTTAVYAALVTASTGGGVGLLQRSMSGLRLASVCTKAEVDGELRV
jgi:hypothetical protein